MSIQTGFALARDHQRPPRPSSLTGNALPWPWHAAPPGAPAHGQARSSGHFRHSKARAAHERWSRYFRVAMNLKLVPRYFIRGCLVTAPLAATVYVVWMTLGTIDNLLPFPIPGLGLIVTLSLITLVGFLTSNVVGRSVIELTEHALQRLPLVKLLYTSVKDLVSAFVGDKRRFNEPVLVTLVAGSELRVLGFVTRHGMASLSLPHHVAVYLPQSYNFAGNLVLVPREQVEPIDLATSDVMTFIVSGGISGFGVGQSILPESPKL